MVGEPILQVNFYHFRNKDKVEVDIILEQGTQLSGIEIKASATIRNIDFQGLTRLKKACGKIFSSGVVFYDGDKLYAVPLCLLTLVMSI